MLPGTRRVARHKKGDLVHIPQAVMLIDCDNNAADDPQLTIPLKIEETKCPKIGVVTAASPDAGYIKVYCDGNTWSVKNDSIYTVDHRRNK